jgi:hypothetical protein
VLRDVVGALLLRVQIYRRPVAPSLIFDSPQGHESHYR